MALTLDASAAVRVVMDAARQPAAIARLRDADVVYAPSLLRIETANALWKYLRAGHLDVAQARERHWETLDLVDIFVDEAELFPEALDLALRRGHPVYDCVYALVARRNAAAMLSFDARLKTLCAESDIDVVIVDD